MEIISRKNAMASGASYYFTGLPCKHGHIAKRHVRACVCVDCVKAHREKPESRARMSEYNRMPEQREKSRISAARYHKANRESCLEKMRLRNKVYYARNRERIKAQTLAYQAENGEARNRYKSDWAKNRAKSDPVFKMSLVCRRMLHRVLGVAGQRKYKNTRDYLPYTCADLVESLEAQFQEGMSWENYGEWHIDHKTPIAHFIKTGVIDPAIINALDNLQPLWAGDNLAKGSKVPIIKPMSRMKISGI